MTNTGFPTAELATLKVRLEEIKKGTRTDPWGWELADPLLQAVINLSERIEALESNARKKEPGT